MSEVRLPDAIFSCRIPQGEGKKSLRIEIFSSLKWKRQWRPHTGKPPNMSPKPPILPRYQEEWFSQHFRLRVDGRWWNTSDKKYQFFTREDAFLIISHL